MSKKQRSRNQWVNNVFTSERKKMGVVVKVERVLHRCAIKSKRRAAMSQVRLYLKKNDIDVPDQDNECIRIFGSELGVFFQWGLNTRLTLKDQLVALYDDPGFDAIGPKISNFYWSPAWRSMREQVFDRLGRQCLKCGSNKHLHIDHIKPRSKYPELELCLENLQVLCRGCNIRKSNRNEVDYRSRSTAIAT